jgi:hypothetical protein
MYCCGLFAFVTPGMPGRLKAKSSFTCHCVKIHITFTDRLVLNIDGLTVTRRHCLPLSSEEKP